MAQDAPIYDLVLLLDPAAQSETHDTIVADVGKLIEANGATTVGTHDWGRRKTAYEIDKKAEAEYRLIQFQGPPTVPSELSRVLRITDGVLRHRIVRLEPGTPPPPNLRASATAAPAAPAEEA